MVIIVDYGMGNAGSIINMLSKLDVECKLSNETHDLEKARALILPGVGSFAQGMLRIKELGLDHIITRLHLNKLPILGICLGAQLLTESSEEHGFNKGLGLLKGVKTVDLAELGFSKLPRIGWVNLKTDMSESFRFYHVHRFFMKCSRKDLILGITDDIYSYPVWLNEENVTAVQFHPEKSHRYGFEFFKKWLIENQIKE